MLKNKVNGSGSFCCLCPGWVCTHCAGCAHPSSWLGGVEFTHTGTQQAAGQPQSRNLHASSSQGLAAIPLSTFYSEAHKNNYTNFIRFCFAKVRYVAAQRKARLGVIIRAGLMREMPKRNAGCFGYWSPIVASQLEQPLLQTHELSWGQQVCQGHPKLCPISILHFLAKAGTL